MTARAFPNSDSGFDCGRWLAERHDRLRFGVIEQLRTHGPRTATQMRVALDAGMRELDHILQQLRKEGAITTRRRWWHLVEPTAPSEAPCAG